MNSKPSTSPLPELEPDDGAAVEAPPRASLKGPSLRWRLQNTPLTVAVGASCLLVYGLGLLVPSLFEQGVMVPDKIWEGELWRLLSAVFLHVGVVHLGFNLVWWLELGSAVELRQGSGGLLLVMLMSGLSGSLAELAGAGLGYPGSVGLSGAVYGLFFFGFVALRPLGGPFGRLFSKQNALVFLGWGLLCVLATWLKLFGVANLGHGAGALMGAATGWVVLQRSRGRRRIGSALCALGLVGLLFLGLRPPHSSLYQSWQAEQAFKAGRYQKASEAYRTASRLSPEQSFLRVNLALSLGYAGHLPEARAVARALEDGVLAALPAPTQELLRRLREPPRALPPRP